jgi:hypothetical protein
MALLSCSRDMGSTLAVAEGVSGSRAEDNRHPVVKLGAQGSRLRRHDRKAPHPFRPVLKSAGLHLRKRLRLSHDRGPPQRADFNPAWVPKCALRRDKRNARECTGHPTWRPHLIETTARPLAPHPAPNALLEV